MSIEFSQELDAPIITPTLTGQDAGEVESVRASLADTPARRKQKETSQSTLKPPGGGGNPWTTHFSTALPAWAKPP